MKKSLSAVLCPLVVLLGALSANAAITAVVETNGDNEATDTITAKWTGVTWNSTVANEPLLATPAGTPFTVPVFGSAAPGYVDRAHRYLNDPGDAAATPPRPLALPVPSYLVGLQYIMSGNDNRDNATYILDVTVNSPSRAYMLIDTRMGDANAVTPPTFGATSMQWITTQGWLPRTTARNRTASLLIPDEVAHDEGGDGSIQTFFSVYYKDFAPGTFRLLQADNAGQNMYGVVVGPIPEPGTLGLFGLGLAGIFRRRRRA